MNQPPAWMLQLSTENAIVSAFMKLGRQKGFDQKLYEELAQWLAASNSELITKVEGLLRTTPPPPLFVCPKCLRASFHPEDIKHQYCGACHT